MVKGITQIRMEIYAKRFSGKVNCLNKACARKFVRLQLESILSCGIKYESPIITQKLT